jgi:hypothetical protein
MIIVTQIHPIDVIAARPKKRLRTRFMASTWLNALLTSSHFETNVRVTKATPAIPIAMPRTELMRARIGRDFIDGPA